MAVFLSYYNHVLTNGITQRYFFCIIIYNLHILVIIHRCRSQAISTKPECDSDWSDTLIVTCPGAEKPVISRIPSKMVNCIKVGWETLTLKGGTRVENFKVRRHMEYNVNLIEDCKAKFVRMRPDLTSTSLENFWFSP